MRANVTNDHRWSARGGGWGHFVSRGEARLTTPPPTRQLEQAIVIEPRDLTIEHDQGPAAPREPTPLSQALTAPYPDQKPAPLRLLVELDVVAVRIDQIHRLHPRMRAAVDRHDLATARAEAL